MVEQEFWARTVFTNWKFKFFINNNLQKDEERGKTFWKGCVTGFNRVSPCYCALWDCLKVHRRVLKRQTALPEHEANNILISKLTKTNQQWKTQEFCKTGQSLFLRQKEKCTKQKHIVKFPPQPGIWACGFAVSRARRCGPACATPFPRGGRQHNGAPKHWK